MVRAVSPTRILAKLQKFLIHVCTFEFICVRFSVYPVSSVWLKGRLLTPKSV